MAIQPIIERGMYRHTCGSIPGRGTIDGVNVVQKWLRDDRKHTKYCLKLDIQKFYDSIDHSVLMRQFERVIKDERILQLIGKIVDTTQIGVPIGNYTSQWFANFHLQQLDHLIVEKMGNRSCGGAAHFVRYVDDMVIFSSNKRKLHKINKKIHEYLYSVLHLVVKKNWQVFKVESRGVDFLGYVFFHKYTKVRARNFLAFTRHARKIRKLIDSHQTVPFVMAAGFISRYGLLKHCNSFNIIKKYGCGISLQYLKNIIKCHQRKSNNRPVHSCSITQSPKLEP